MRYEVRKSIIRVIGNIWMPSNIQCAQVKELSRHDLENLLAGESEPTRVLVEHWLMLNSGDFSSVHDFEASLEVGDKTFDFPWAKGEESEFAFTDAMHPVED